MFDLNKKGQTLIETIIAVGIITMALVAILALGTASIDYGTHGREEIITSNLAREGIEIIRVIRDSNWLDPNKDAFDNLGDGDWIVDYDNTAATTTADSSDINSCNNCKLYLGGGIYQHGLGAATTYKRLVNITSDGNRKKIVSEVSWTIKSRTKSFNLETYLTDWR